MERHNLNRPKSSIQKRAKRLIHRYSEAACKSMFEFDENAYRFYKERWAKERK